MSDLVAVGLVAAVIGFASGFFMGSSVEPAPAEQPSAPGLIAFPDDRALLADLPTRLAGSRN